MNVIETGLSGCVVIEPTVFGDDRGFFIETYQRARYAEAAGIDTDFVQDNHSFSQRHVLRGLHFQRNKPQGKLVRVLWGEVFDVAVDLRTDSTTFGRWFGLYLSGENKKQLWVPPGFAHGFLVTSETAHFEYKCTDYYDPNDEVGLIWNDPELKIQWPNCSPTLSDKDRTAPSLRDLKF